MILETLNKVLDVLALVANLINSSKQWILLLWIDLKPSFPPKSWSKAIPKRTFSQSDMLLNTGLESLTFTGFVS